MWLQAYNSKQKNDSCVNRHQQLQLQSWRANCDLQLVIDHYACVEYLAQYAAKGEKSLRNTFVAIAKETNLNTDPEATVRKLFIKCVGDRNFGTQEVMHHITS